MTAQNKFINSNIADNAHLVALQELIDVVAKLGFGTNPNQLNSLHN